MQMTKHDVFIFSIKKRDVLMSAVTQPIMVKLYNLFQARLKALGFTNTIVDTMYFIPSLELENAEVATLLQNPFYISEHYMSRSIFLDHYTPESSVLWHPPYQIQPNTVAYSYCDGGKVPMFHAMFVGRAASGKTALMHEFKNLLRELVPAIEIIVCDNGVYEPGAIDITKDREFYTQHLKDLSGNAINIGGAPNYVVAKGTIFHNTKV